MINIKALARIEGTSVAGLRNRTSIGDLPFRINGHFKSYGPSHLMALALQRELIAQSLMRRETAEALQGIEASLGWLIVEPEGGALLFFKYHERGEATVGAVVGRKNELLPLLATSGEAAAGGSIQLVLVDAAIAWTDAVTRAAEAGFALTANGIAPLAGAEAA